MILISGGQTGADIAGLRVASSLGIPTSGYAASNFMTELGPYPDLAGYGLIDEGLSFKQRTILNCSISDITLMFVFDVTSSGSKIVKQNCKNLKIINLNSIRKIETQKPKIHFELEIKKIISNFDLEEGMIINIAGNRESCNPGHVERLTSLILQAALAPFADRGFA